MPKRIQRKRTKGWRMPENTVSVCRPGKWGNPYRVGIPVREQIHIRTAVLSGAISMTEWRENKPLTNEQAVKLFRYSVERYPKIWKRKDMEKLKGKNLACWCRLDQPCHADVLLKLANT